MIRLFQTLWTLATDEIARMRWALISIFLATFAGVLLILIFEPAVVTSLWICSIPWGFTLYRLFSIRRIMRVHLIGETVDAVQRQNQPNNLLDNELIRLYLNVVTNMMLIQTILFISLPLLINLANWNIGLIIPIAMISVAILLMSTGAFFHIFRGMAFISIAVLMLIVLGTLLPQAVHYSKIMSWKVMPASSAEIVNEIERTRQRQVEEINNALLRDALKWQEKHPGARLPEAYQEVISAAEKGLPVTQLRIEKLERAAKQNRLSAEKAAQERKLAQAAKLTAQAAPALAVAPQEQIAPEPTRPEICNHSSGMLQWENDYSSGAMVSIECVGDSIILRDTKAGTVFDITNGEWRYNSEHGKLLMSPTSRDNILADGTMGTERGGIPIRLKKGFS